MNNYYFQFSDIQTVTLQDVISKVKESKGIALKDLTFKNLFFHDDEPISSGCGVYIFKDNDRVFYVGKCSSRNFADRITSHFDLRPEAMLNGVIKLISKKITNPNNSDKPEYSNKDLIKASKHAFENFYFMMINFKEWNKEDIQKLENILREILGPVNAPKRKRFTDLNRTINECFSGLTDFKE